jgi:hypothetical protein
MSKVIDLGAPPPGHKLLPDGRCEHRWRNRVTAAVRCRFLDGFLAGVASRLPDAPPAGTEADHERQILEVINERDHAIDMADRIAEAFVPADVLGEHSNINDPWQNALDYAAGAYAPTSQESGNATAGSDL